MYTAEFVGNYILRRQQSVISMRYALSMQNYELCDAAYPHKLQRSICRTKNIYYLNTVCRYQQ